jgi:hypothetical protein
MPGTGLFNEGLDDLATTLLTITNLPVVRDPRNISPGCVLIGAPTFEAWNYNIAKMTVPVQIISSGPGNQDALDQLLTIASQLMAKNVAVTDGRPTSIEIGGTICPGYDLTIEMQVQTA